ncbi:hypothetical protein DPEC_G00165190 [Dallia pectoralis]|uniref:Uncharacterized protein n=1 Tax=Dallia pectoralis TaxID=75939 RepID=A0ACC2GHN0_DALPE|nr:hypothetical protein DPEC_G00165190 [Dallia pectoralis]
MWRKRPQVLPPHCTNGRPQGRNLSGSGNIPEAASRALPPCMATFHEDHVKVGIRMPPQSCQKEGRRGVRRSNSGTSRRWRSHKGAGNSAQLAQADT